MPMKCPGPSFQWEDYLDARLDISRMRELEEHLRTCALCRRELEQARELRERLSVLSKRMTPERDLWPGIEDRIRRPAGPSRKLPIYGVVPLAAAALLVAAFVVVSVVRTEVPVSSGGLPFELVSLAGGQQGMARRFSEVDRRYRKVKREFLKTVKSGEDGLDPRFVRTVEAQLAAIDRAVAELESALREQPESRELWLLMAQANENRMEILQIAQTYLY
jgi:hypothetical protein